MGVIQQGINQLFSTATLFKTLGNKVNQNMPDPEASVQEKVKAIQEERQFRGEVNKALEAAGQAPYYSPEQVMGKLAQKGMTKVEQGRKRRDFMKFLKSGQLPGTENLAEPALRQIRDKFTRAEKTALMNEYEKKGGKS